MAILTFAIGVFIVQEIRYESMPAYSGSYEGEAVFREGFKSDGDSVRGFMELEQGGLVYGSYRFSSPEEKESLTEPLRNSSLKVKGIFEQPSDASHEFAFDMGRYLKNNGASSLLKIEKLEYGSELKGFKAGLSNRRENLKNHIRQNFPESLTVEAEALLIGERETVNAEQQKVQQTLGISHLFAISGLHVGIVSALMYFIMLRCGMRKETAMILLLILLPLYAFMAGGAPSVWRAVSMATAVLVLKLFRIRIPIATILLVSFVLMLLADPYNIYKIGFQLSYGASFGIIYSLKWIEAAKSPFLMSLLITFVSQFTLYPLLLFHFYGMSISSFIVNSLFVPLYTVVILPVNIVLLGLTFLFQPGADFVFYFYGPFRTFLDDWTVWLAEWPHQMWVPGKPGGLMLVIMVAGVMIFYGLVDRGFRWWKVAIGIFPAIAFTFIPYFDNSLKVTFIDVGQGDSALIELPYRRGVYLIDTGGILRFGREGFDDRDRPFEVGRQIVAPYLHGKGIASIDKLILSHPDADHAEGAEEILQLFNVKELHLTPGSESTEIIKDLQPDMKGTAVRYPGQGSYWRNRDIRFTYLSPDDTNYEGNNDSLVLLMEYGKFKLLFTGDLETDGEKRIITMFGDHLEGITVLKVGHHGSKTSSGEEFLLKLNPELSIFSAGKNNRYGHPAKEVVERFDKFSLQTLSTAEQGTIEIIFQNGSYNVNSSK